MIPHWEKGDVALSDDDDICIEWGDTGDYLWFDIDRDGTFRTLRGYRGEGRVENVFNDANAAFIYVKSQLKEIYGPPTTPRKGCKGDV